MAKFNLYYGVEKEEFDLYVVEVELPTILVAKEEAKDYAEDLYMQDPSRDVLDIIREDKVEEWEAIYLFENEMSKNIVYHIEEIVEIDGRVVEIIRHDWK